METFLFFCPNQQGDKASKATAGNTKGRKYHCTIDLLFDWSGLESAVWELTFFVFICKTD